jgi:hypothetical protein
MKTLIHLLILIAVSFSFDSCNKTVAEELVPPSLTPAPLQTYRAEAIVHFLNHCPYKSKKAAQVYAQLPVDVGREIAKHLTTKDFISLYNVYPPGRAFILYGLGFPPELDKSASEELKSLRNEVAQFFDAFIIRWKRVAPQDKANTLEEVAPQDKANEPVISSGLNHSKIMEYIRNSGLSVQDIRKYQATISGMITVDFALHLATEVINKKQKFSLKHYVEFMHEVQNKAISLRFGLKPNTINYGSYGEGISGHIELFPVFTSQNIQHVTNSYSQQASTTWLKKNLLTLDLNSQNITSIHWSIEGLRDILGSLNLSGNPITHNITHIKFLTNLHTLCISHLPHSLSPEWINVIKVLPKLDKLNLTNTNLSKIPKLKSASLTWIDLSGCTDISQSLLESIIDMPQLETLHLERANLSQTTDLTIFKRSTSLKRLYCSGMIRNSQPIHIRSNVNISGVNPANYVVVSSEDSASPIATPATVIPAVPQPVVVPTPAPQPVVALTPTPAPQPTGLLQMPNLYRIGLATALVSTVVYVMIKIVQQVRSKPKTKSRNSPQLHTKDTGSIKNPLKAATMSSVG